MFLSSMGALMPDLVLESELRVQVEYVGTMPFELGPGLVPGTSAPNLDAPLLLEDLYRIGPIPGLTEIKQFTLNLNPDNINENDLTELTGTIDGLNAGSDVTVTINWGAPLSPNNVEQFTFNASDTGSQEFTITHQYLDDNPTETSADTYTINATVTDSNDATDTESETVLVKNVAPAITALTVERLTEAGDDDDDDDDDDDGDDGNQVKLNGTFTDPGTLDEHNIIIDWGDGTTDTLTLEVGARDFMATHTYLDDDDDGDDDDDDDEGDEQRIFTIEVTVKDDDGGSTTFASLPNGIASGDTTQDSTVFWTRSTVLGDVTFEYSTAPNFNTIEGFETAAVTDPNLPVKVEVTDLTPGTKYFYRVTDPLGTTARGEFKTAAPLGVKAGLRFGVSGDWRGELAPYPAISNAVDSDLAFFVEHGDTIYADFPSPAVPKEQAETLEEYRAKHAEVYGTRFGSNVWGDLRASTSILATIDDHEVTNDFAGGADVSTDSRFIEPPGTLINDSQLYENGLQAFQEYNPLRDEFYGSTGEVRTEDERQLYRFNTYGSDAAVMVLDSRSFRDEALPGVSDLNDPAQVGAFLTASFDPSRTMLGQQQLEDLKQDLLEAQQEGITWKFIMVPEPIQNLGVINASDRFEGYAAERTEILQFINKNEIDNVVFVAADIHGTVVNNLTYQESPLGPQIATDAFEVTTGSVAYDAPFGPTVIELASGLGIPGVPTLEEYNALPSAVQEAIIQGLLNGQIEPLGYDPVGLDNNLAIADGLIDATLLQGGYTATNTFGWTEFDINAVTQTLTVTTYGIEPYSEEELLAAPQSIIERTPTIVSQFEVYPDLRFNSGNGQELLSGGSNSHFEISAGQVL